MRGPEAPLAVTVPTPLASTYPPPPRPRGRLRGVFVGISAAVLAVGILLLAISLDPGAFGLSSVYRFPFAGGFLGVFLVLWGSLLLVRVALWTGRRGRFGPGGPGGRRFDPAILEARRRYAHGEISREQFQQIVQDLRRPPGPPP